MANICPSCNEKFSLFDRISQPSMCSKCFKQTNQHSTSGPPVVSKVVNISLQKTSFIVTLLWLVTLSYFGSISGFPAIIATLCFFVFGGIHFFSMLTDAAAKRRYVWVVFMFFTFFIATFVYYLFCYIEGSESIET